MGNSAGLVKRVEVPQFNGEYEEYHSWREGFNKIVGELNIEPEYKMVHLRRCLSGDAKKAVRDLGCSDISYTVALQRLERRYGGDRRKKAIQRDDINQFRPIRPGNATDLEHFAELLDVVVVRLVEDRADQELAGGFLYDTLLLKLNEALLGSYRKWLQENRTPLRWKASACS